MVEHVKCVCDTHTHVHVSAHTSQKAGGNFGGAGCFYHLDYGKGIAARCRHLPKLIKFYILDGCSLGASTAIPAKETNLGKHEI